MRTKLEKYYPINLSQSRRQKHAIEAMTVTVNKAVLPVHLTRMSTTSLKEEM